MAKYVTIQGDTWDIVSLRVYGTEMNVDKLIEANTAYRELVFFPANIELTAPEISQTTNLPPWRR